MNHLYNEYRLQVACLILDIFLLKIDKEKSDDLVGAVGENAAFVRKITRSFKNIGDEIGDVLKERVSDELQASFWE